MLCFTFPWLHNWIDCFLMLSCVSYAILEANPLLNILFANIFCHSGGCLFILLVVSFMVQKLFNLMSSICLFFYFVALTWGGRSRKILLRFMSKNTLPVFSPGVLLLYLIHIEFVFVYVIRKWPSLILVPVTVQFSKHHLLISLSFPQCIFLGHVLTVNYENLVLVANLVYLKEFKYHILRRCG